MAPDAPPKLEIDWLKTAGGAFAAVSSAFLLSTLGAAGTIIGAAIGSVIITVGGALYTQGLARSHHRLAQVQAAAVRKVGAAQAEVQRAAQHAGDSEALEADLVHAEERLDDVKEDLGAIADEPTSPGWRERVAMLPWKQISLVAAGLFATAVLLITAFELLAGRSVSSITGGSEEGDGPTITRIVGGSDGDAPEEEDRVPPGDRSSPSVAPSDEPAEEPAPTDVTTGESTPSPEPLTPVPTTSDTLPTDTATPPTG